MIPPATIPLIAPYLFERFQNNAKSITGPNVAPKPAQANDTIWNTELLGLLARNIAIIEMIITEPLATTIFTPAERFKLNTPSSKFSETLEDAARSCESEVDIVEASIPARITPAIMAKIMPCVLNTWAI